MATTRGKAEAFRKELHRSVEELLSKFTIDKEDVTVNATINVLDMVRYSSNSVDDGEE